MTFKDPWILFVIPLIWILFVLLKKRRTVPTFNFPSISILGDFKNNWKAKLVNNLIFLRLIVLSLFLIALSAPREVLEHTEISTEGIDIILAIDASGSMAAMDFSLDNKRVNRLKAVKNVISDFIEARRFDRIAFVAFAAQAYTVSPLTTDHNWLKSNLERIELGVISEDGTAIGSAITTALARIKTSKAKSRIIILLTDGVNNTGKIDPLTAAKAAQALGIKIYTIGAGTRGLAPYPVQDLFGRVVYQNVQVEIDEDILKEILVASILVEIEISRARALAATRVLEGIMT